MNITLSKQGKKLYDLIEERYNSYYSKVFGKIPPEKHNQIVESFSIFYDAMKRNNQSKKCCGVKKNKKGECEE